MRKDWQPWVSAVEVLEFECGCAWWRAERAGRAVSRSLPHRLCNLRMNEWVKICVIMAHNIFHTKPCVFTVPDAHSYTCRLSQAKTMKDVYTKKVLSNLPHPTQKLGCVCCWLFCIPRMVIQPFICDLIWAVVAEFCFVWFCREVTICSLVGHFKSKN